MRCLLVEDDENSSRYIEVLLHEFPSKLFIARDGRSCRKLIKSRDYQIIFVDLKLPDESGLDIIPLVRNTLPESRIIVQSAFATQSTIDQAMNLGANDYLTKPVSKKKLLEVVKQFTNGKC